MKYVKSQSTAHSLKMVNKIRPQKFQAPQKSKRCRAVSRLSNRQHLNLGLHSSTSDTGRKTVPLIRVKLEHSYPEVVKWSDKQAETYLRKHDVLPQKKEKVNCWQCGEILSRAKFVIQWSRPDLRRCVTMFQLPYAWSASFAAVTCIAFLDSLLVLHAARICAPVQNLSSASLLDRRNS